MALTAFQPVIILFVKESLKTKLLLNYHIPLIRIVLNNQLVT
jgi:hypothetical protein